MTNQNRTPGWYWVRMGLMWTVRRWRGERFVTFTGGREDAKIDEVDGRLEHPRLDERDKSQKTGEG